MSINFIFFQVPFGWYKIPNLIFSHVRKKWPKSGFDLSAVRISNCHRAFGSKWFQKHLKRLIVCVSLSRHKELWRFLTTFCRWDKEQLSRIQKNIILSGSFNWTCFDNFVIESNWMWLSNFRVFRCAFSVGKSRESYNFIGDTFLDFSTSLVVHRCDRTYFSSINSAPQFSHENEVFSSLSSFDSK